VSYVITSINYRYRIATILSVLLTACGGGGGGGESSTNSNPTIGLSISDAVQVIEGDNNTVDIVYSITLDSVASSDITVDYQTSDQTANAGEDYQDASGTLLIPAGDLTSSLTVVVNSDQCFEPDEEFLLSLSNISSGASLNNTNSVATIVNDDLQSVLNIADASMPEADAGQSDLNFMLSFDKTSCYDTTVDYSTSNVTAEQGSDYIQSAGTITIPANTSSANISVPVIGDLAFEDDETFSLSLSNISQHALLGIDSAFGSIVNDDLPNLIILPTSINEGDITNSTLVFQAILEGPVGAVSFDYSTSDDTATLNNNDYLEATGTATILAGQTTTQIPVTVVADTVIEADEDFLLTLSNVSGAVLVFDNVVGTILDDDNTVIPSTPRLTLSSIAIQEGNAGDVTSIPFTLNLSEVLASNLNLSYEIVEGSATSSVDYSANNGTATIAAGSLSTTINIDILGDDDIESDETFYVVFASVPNSIEMVNQQVTGRILDDDDTVAAPIKVFADNARIDEGDSGVKDLVFSIVLSEAASDSISIDYNTLDASALSLDDFTEVSGTLVFNPGVTELTVSVPINGDVIVEADEAFSLLLSNLVSNATVILADASAEGLIISDDPFTRLTLNDAGIEEGDAGNTALVFDVTLSDAAGDDVTVDFQTIDATATVADNDYVPTSGTLTIAAGQLTGEISADIIGDMANEADESFSLILENLSANAILNNDIAIGSIVNDDNSIGWGVPQLIDSTGIAQGEGILPKIKMNASGEAMVAWYDYVFVSGEMLSARYLPGMSWQTIEPIEMDNAIDFDLDINSNGDIVIGWGFGEASVNRYTAGADWGAEIDILQREIEHTDTRIVSNNAGDTFALWVSQISNSPQWNLRYSLYDASQDNWSIAEDVVVDGLGQPGEIAVDKDGPDINAIIVWPANTFDASGMASGLRTSFYDPLNNTWLPSIEVTDPGASPGYSFGYNPKVDMDTNGNAMIVWDDETGSGSLKNHRALAKYYDVVDGWSDPVVLDITLQNSYSPQVKFDGSGNAIVVWLDESSTDEIYSIHSRRYHAATDTWEPALTDAPNVIADASVIIRTMDHTVSDGQFDLAHPEVDELGNAFVVWSQDVNGTGDHAIRASRYSVADDLWSAPEPIGDDTLTGDSGLAKIASDANGNAIAVWEQYNIIDDKFEIWVNRYTAP